ncbi:MAG: lactonase family protein [Saprospiraceae bacterium]|nr:lactonase family protein [Saprospiraceae bacterium]
MKNLLFLLLIVVSCTTPKKDLSQQPIVFVGTYTQKLGHVDGKAFGIYTCRMDTQTGELTVVDSVGGIANPSFLTISPDKKYLYAVAENGGKPEEPFGSVVAYKITAGGKLLKINEMPSYGVAPCFVSTDQAGQNVYIANYVTGNVVSYHVKTDGGLSDSISTHQHKGDNEAWAHQIIQSPDGKYLLSCDKGADKIYVYNYDSTGKLLPLSNATITLQKGAGPRHLAFNPLKSNQFYVINEVDNTLSTVAFSDKSVIEENLPTLPYDFSGKSFTADVHVHPNGKFVYGSNRGHNSIVVFAANENTGKLAPIQHESTKGLFPRNFMITPDGGLLLVANQNSSNIVAFKIDEKTGKLTPTGANSCVFTPVCLKML